MIVPPEIIYMEWQDTPVEIVRQWLSDGRTETVFYLNPGFQTLKSGWMITGHKTRFDITEEQWEQLKALTSRIIQDTRP